jgi:hypothetical protein
MKLKSKLPDIGVTIFAHSGEVGRLFRMIPATDSG